MTAHRTVRLVLATLAGLLLAGTVATIAQAEDGYRFWGYYQWSSGQWAFSQKGADAVVPADGAVEGWRHAGYPAKGCGDQVKSIQVPATDAPVTLQIGAAVGSTAVTSPASSSSDDGGDGAPWSGIIIAAVVVLALAGGGLALNRRRTAK